jgi:DNA helicase-2/ATP-dependent DNA helicase PcrA
MLLAYCIARHFIWKNNTASHSSINFMAFPNEEQRTIMEHTNGAVLVIAPAGTGKTRTLAARVCRAVEHKIAEPRRVLCLTFTNRAAAEMRRALRETGVAWAGEVVIKTFHALCAYMLRAEAREIGLPADFVIYDEQDAEELVTSTFSINQRYLDQKDRNKIKRDCLTAIADAKVDAALHLLSLNFPALPIARQVFARMEASDVQRAMSYQQALQDHHALDFGDLVYYTRAMLHCIPEIRQRWAGRFDFIQVDEMQDTHPTVYEIVHALVTPSGNLAMIGDLAQTIYSWRGSKPTEVVTAFKRDFKPATLPLTKNYRATRVLLKASDSFAQSCNRLDGRYATLVPSDECQQGDNIEIATRANEMEEATWIGQRLMTLANGQVLAEQGKQSSAPAFAFSKVAVLGRTNKRAQTIYEVIQARFGDALPCVTVEQYEFFRRDEVKRALAYVRLLVNPHDASAMRRIHIAGVGDRTIETIYQQGEVLGLRLTDFAQVHTLTHDDPFGQMLDAYSSGTIVVFDTETTGLNPASDEIIEIAGHRLVNGRCEAEFHRYIRVADVGDSVHIHGITNAELAEKGEPAQRVLRDFLAFAQGALLVGHNVGFDIKMLSAHARRLGLNPPAFDWHDTCDAARRFIRSENYRLSTLAEGLGLPSTPSHRADDDVRTTVELLDHMIPLMRRHARERTKLVGQYAQLFNPFATQMGRWRTGLHVVRPTELLQRILIESALLTAYRRDEQANRQANLSRLAGILAQRDDPALHPETALHALLEYAATASNVDQVAQGENRVMICTVHQAKGLEFDHVFIAGAVQGEFPNFFASKPEQHREEERLFYVAMTRARKRLFISRHIRNERNYMRDPSPYLAGIDPAYYTEV